MYANKNMNKHVGCLCFVGGGGAFLCHGLGSLFDSYRFGLFCIHILQIISYRENIANILLQSVFISKDVT